MSAARLEQQLRDLLPAVIADARCGRASSEEIAERVVELVMRCAGPMLPGAAPARPATGQDDPAGMSP